MKIKILASFYFLFVVLNYTHILAQQTDGSNQANNPVTDFNRPSLETAFKLYNNKFSDKLAYINGREYKPYFYRMTVSPYLYNIQGIATLYIQGEIYPYKPVYLDIFLDELVLLPSVENNSKSFIQVNKSIIDSFIIDYTSKSLSFVNLNLLNSSLPKLKSGFYEMVYKGKFQYLIKYSADLSTQQGYSEYLPVTNKYLFKDGVYYDINTKKKFLDLFKNNRKELKKRFRKAKVWYKDLKNTQMIDLIRYSETF